MSEQNISPKKPFKRDTVTNQVYSEIRRNIIDMEYKPGDSLSEKELSTDLGVSKTPVREAFIRLEKEGLLEILPQVGTFISKISINRVKEEKFLRESLEKANFEIFLDSYSEECILKLKQNIELQKLALKNENFSEFIHLDDEFHNIFYNQTKNLLSGNLVSEYCVNYQRMRLLSVSLSGDSGYLRTDEHQKLIDSIISNDRTMVFKILDNHLKNLFATLDEVVYRYRDYFID